jgi:hypothetical protein
MATATLIKRGDESQPTATLVRSGGMQQQAPQEEPGFLDRVGSLAQKRGAEVAQTQMDYERGLISSGERALQMIGKGVFGTLNDIVGETVGSVFSALTPDEAEDWLKEQIASGAESVMKTRNAKELLAWYQSLDPQERKNWESGANIFAGLMPLKGTKAVGVGKTTKIAAKKKAFSKLFTQQGKNVDEALNQRVLNTLVDTPGLKPRHGATPDKAIEIMKKERDRLDGLIDDSLRKYDGVQPSVGDLDNFVNNRIDQLRSRPAWSELGKTADADFKSMTNILDGFTSKYKLDGIPAHKLPEIRKKFDNDIILWGKNRGIDNIIESQHPLGKLARAMRNGVNDLIDQKAGVDAKALRGRQSNLYIAQKNLKNNAKKGKGTFKQAFDYALQHPFMVGAALQGGGLFSNPAVLTGLGLGATGYGIAKSAPNIAIGAGRAMQASPAASGLFYGYDENKDVQQ